MNSKNVIQNTLNRTGLDKIQPSQSIVDKALSFDVKDLDVVGGADITKFIVGLSQYLIYIILEENKLKIRRAILEREIDVSVAIFVAKNKITKATKAEKRLMAIGSSANLINKEEKLNNILVELSLLDSIGKYLEFYVNSLKKELHRRECELNFKSA
jgi:hypothetical protein